MAVTIPRPVRLLPAILYVLLIYGFIFLPVVVLVLFSFQESRIPIPPFNGPSLKWYEAVFSDARMMGAMGNSVMVGVASSAVAVVLGYLAAYALARYRLPGERFWRAFLVSPLSVSYLIIAMGLLIALNSAGFPKSLAAIGVGHVVINLPICFAIVFSQMGEHQANIERAARDLGAREWQVMLFVSAPMLWPALFAAFFLTLTFSWDEFIIAFLLSRFDVTLPVEIWSSLKTGLNPKTNAVGSVVFLVSIGLVLVLDLVILRKRRH